MTQNVARKIAHPEGYFGTKYIEHLLGEHGENVIYTKDNEDIHQLLSNRRRMPEAMADDVLAKNMIPQTEEEVKAEYAPPKMDGKAGTAC